MQALLCAHTLYCAVCNAPELPDGPLEATRADFPEMHVTWVVFSRFWSRLVLASRSVRLRLEGCARTAFASKVNPCKLRPNSLIFKSIVFVADLLDTN